MKKAATHNAHIARKNQAEAEPYMAIAVTLGIAMAIGTGIITGSTILGIVLGVMFAFIINKYLSNKHAA